MNFRWLILASAGLVILVLSTAAARKSSIPVWESRIFHAINGLPSGLCLLYTSDAADE